MKHFYRKPLLVLGLLGVGTLSHATHTLDEVVVTGTREGQRLVETPASIGTVKSETLREDKPSHPTQLMSQIPGAAVSVTNGEGHTTAIRQPFTTSPVYLFLEDGIPIRSTGFFNHNGLYEINIPQSDSVEVIRGPGTALYGSDAIGGVINVMTRPSPAKPEASVSGEIGSFGWRRVLVDGGNTSDRGGWRASVNMTHTDGWRDATGYDRQGGNFRWDRSLGDNAVLKTIVSFSKIDQQTGASSPLPENDYRNNPTRNYLSVAFRKVDALRVSSAYERESGNDLLSITPYVRDNRMNLLASFNLNNDPTVSDEENRSFGLLAKWRRDFPEFMRARLIFGTDIDVSPGTRTEDALYANASGTSPARQFHSVDVAGRIYDYDVTFREISPYVHGEISPIDKLRITAGLRYDYLTFDFDNHLPAGAIQIAPAGGANNFPTGNRFYGQAEDTSIDFQHVSPKLGFTYAVAKNMHAFASYNHGFRVPSQSQLFRPSFGTSAAAAVASSQSALGLSPIKADQIELGVRGAAHEISYDAVIYQLVKKDDIVSQRDTATNFTQTVNAGKTEHRGVEIGAGVPATDEVRVDVAASYARHTYKDFVTTNGNFSGNDIESAPRTLLNTRLTWKPAPETRLQVEWVRVGWYWMDANNTQRYPGHTIYNVRANQKLTNRVSLFGSVHNLVDTRYADSAQISSNQPVFNPGLPRTLYAGVEATW